MTYVFHESDADPTALAGKTVAVIGYGNMGRPAALNLRDSGVQVIVSEPRPERQAEATAEGFTLTPIAEAVQAADILLPMFRDEQMPQTYMEHVSPYLRRGHTLIFSSAYNITFRFIEAPSFVDVGLVSAKTLGAAVRERYVNGQGFPSFVAVEQDASREAWRTVLGIAHAMGALRAGAVEIKFEQESELDLFVQQAILPVLHQAVILAANTLLDAGYPPEAVFTELYLSGETSDYLRLASQIGLNQALELNSLTAQYGTLSRYDRFNDLKLERMMQITLDEIRSGKFAEEWAREYASDYPRLRQLQRERRALDLWTWEQQTIEELHTRRSAAHGE
jgi:ketol-acid reductoisomerase